jgi:ubiquinone/menaquinone biosynthesis C-methylase UbiE
MDTRRERGADAYKLPEVAEAYDARPPYPAEAITYLLQHTLPPSQEGLPRVLDAGAGNGLVTEALLNSNVPMENIALDRSAAMIAALCCRLSQDHVPAFVGDFNRLPFAENSLDLVVFGTSLHWADPDLLPAELYRTLRPGGSVVSIGNSVPIPEIFSHFHQDTILYQKNPITANGREIDLGDELFSSKPRLFAEFPRTVTMTKEEFNQFLMSIDLFHVGDSGTEAAWAAAEQYFTDNADARHITLAVNTFIRIAKTKK